MQLGWPQKMAAAAGKKRSTSHSLFLEAFGLEVEEELSTIATQTWAERVWTGKWNYEQKEPWIRQIREVQTWKQVRGPAGAVTCETRDLGVIRPQWHTLMFRNEIKIDMRFVCPKELKKKTGAEGPISALEKVNQGKLSCERK